MLVISQCYCLCSLARVGIEFAIGPLWDIPGGGCFNNPLSWSRRGCRRGATRCCGSGARPGASLGRHGFCDRASPRSPRWGLLQQFAILELPWLSSWRSSQLRLWGRPGGWRQSRHESTIFSNLQKVLTFLVFIFKFLSPSPPRVRKLLSRWRCRLGRWVAEVVGVIVCWPG